MDAPSQLTLLEPPVAGFAHEPQERSIVNGWEPGRNARERARLEALYRPLMREDLSLGRLVSYVGNKSLPLLRLFRYKEAYSLAFVHRMLDRFGTGPADLVLDPFAGMGTTLFASAARGIPSVGVERLPVAAFVSRTLPLFLDLTPEALEKAFAALARAADRCEPAEIAADVPLVRAAFDEPVLTRLRQWKTAIGRLDPPLRDVFTLLLLSVLEATSYVSNDGQFPRLKRSKRLLPPDEALRLKVSQAREDVAAAKRLWGGLLAAGRTPYRVFDGDARDLSALPLARRPTVLITSPPYANRYDYTRSYCLELCFHFVRDFQELKRVRLGVLRSHIESRAEAGDAPPHPAVAEVVEVLRSQPLNNPRIPAMLTAYFVDMERAIRSWAGALAPGARVALVVDNVRFHGQVVPVDLVLCDLARRHGFLTEEVVVARYKGNSSQQMGRYGRVPVRESVVVWRNGG